MPIEQWELANRLLDTRPSRADRGVRSPDGHVHLLKGLLRCGDCSSAMTPYASGHKDADGNPYLYYTCTSVLKYHDRCECRIRSLPARKLARGVLAALADLASDPEKLADCVQSSLAFDRAALDAAHAKSAKLSKRLELVNQSITRLVRVFEETEVVPLEMKRRCHDLEDERLRLEVELALATRRVHELREHDGDPAAVAEFLGSFLGTLETLSMPEKKILIQETVGSVIVNYSLSDATSEPSDDEFSGPIIRKPEILVNIAFKAKAPEQGCSGASGGTCANRKSDFPEFNTTGSPTRTTGGTRLSDSSFAF